MAGARQGVRSLQVSRRASHISRILLAAFGVVLACIVLTPSDGNTALDLTRKTAEWLSRIGVPYREAHLTVEFIANMALFVPLGFLVPLALGSMRPKSFVLAVCVAFLASMAIETAQLLIPGRMSDPRDLFSNTLGALLGVLAGLLVRPLLLKPSRELSELDCVRPGSELSCGP